MEKISFALSFDYRCPFAGVLHRHVVTALRAGADFDVEFVPWTLNQNYRKEGDADVWDDPALESHLISLAAGVSLRDQQPDIFLDAHEALFVARHENGVRLANFDEIVDALAACKIDVAQLEADLATRRPYEVIGESFRRFENFEAFGVPTMVVDEDAVFIRYMDKPTDDADASIELITSLYNTLTTRPSLNEYKFTRLSR